MDACIDALSTVLEVGGHVRTASGHIMSLPVSLKSYPRSVKRESCEYALYRSTMGLYTLCPRPYGVSRLKSHGSTVGFHHLSGLR